jgi:hypothetical protein
MNIVIMNLKKTRMMILDRISKHLLKVSLNIKMSKEAPKEECNSHRTNQIKNFNFTEAMKANKKDQIPLRRTSFKLKKRKKDQITSILETIVLVFPNFP